MAIADMNETPMGGKNGLGRRGINVYSLSQIMSVSGRGKNGEWLQGTYEQPFFYLSLEERFNIFRLCSPVFGVVSGRMNRIAGLDFEVVCDSSEEDRDAERFKYMYQIYREYVNAKELKYMVVKGKISMELQRELPDILPDLSNFQGALLRWRRRLAMSNKGRCDEIKEWLLEPNINTKWEDFVKQYSFDMMIHGCCAIYKEALYGKIENFYVLPGGTVIPMKERYVGGKQAYVQVLTGNETQIFFSDECSYSTYLPTSSSAMGIVPLEALINKIAETMLFDKLMAEQADGTAIPEKIVIVADSMPFGDMEDDFKVPIDPDEQKRIQQKVNTPIKGKIMTFSGNTVQVVDLSRENTMQFQHSRQKDIREDVALVFGASNMEMNLSGSDDTSGRSTSEEQAKIAHAKGVAPIIAQLKTKLDRDIIPYRFGFGYKIKWDLGKDDMEEMQILQARMNTGLFSVNEIRTDELNMDPFEGDEFNKPAGGAQGGQPDGSAVNPLNMKQV